MKCGPLDQKLCCKSTTGIYKENIWGIFVKSVSEKVSAFRTSLTISLIYHCKNHHGIDFAVQVKAQLHRRRRRENGTYETAGMVRSVERIVSFTYTKGVS